MTASELRELAEHIKWYSGQIWSAYDRRKLAAAADLLELVAWAEESKVIIDRGDDLWSAWWEGGPQVYGKTLIDTLRRAKEASRG